MNKINIALYYGRPIAIHLVIIDSYQNIQMHFDNVLKFQVKVGTKYVQQPNGFLSITSISGAVNYTEYIRPVCLPCTQSDCFKKYLEQKGLIDGTETEAERCEIESKLLCVKLNRHHFSGNLLPLLL